MATLDLRHSPVRLGSICKRSNCFLILMEDNPVGTEVRFLFVRSGYLLAPPSLLSPYSPTYGTLGSPLKCLFSCGEPSIMDCRLMRTYSGLAFVLFPVVDVAATVKRNRWTICFLLGPLPDPVGITSVICWVFAEAFPRHKIFWVSGGTVEMENLFDLSPVD
jgi:hypothetical protein